MAIFTNNFRETFSGGLPVTLAGGAESGPISRQMVATGQVTSQGKMPQGSFRDRFMGSYRATANPITFRDANKDEEIGMQKIRLLRKDGKEEDVFLYVPKQDNNTYIDWAEGTGEAGKINSTSLGLNKDTRSVGLGGTAESEGQILGMVDASGKAYTAKGAKEFLSNVGDKYVGIVDYETPETNSQISGYIPGSMLLNLLGLPHPQVRSNVSSFSSPSEHYGYNRFLRNLRKNG